MTDGKKCYMTDRVKFSKVILSQENVYGRSSTNKWLQEPCRWSIPHLAMDFWEIVFVTESSLFQRTSIIKYTLNNSTVTILEIWNPSTRHIYTYIQIYILILFQQMIWNDHISNDIYIYIYMGSRSFSEKVFVSWDVGNSVSLEQVLNESICLHFIFI